MKTQHQQIIKILKERGGMNSYEYRMQFIQLPVRIRELKQSGYNIVSRPEKNRSVTYILQAPRLTYQEEQQIKEEAELVRVVKNGRVFWERPEDLKPKQLDLLTSV